MNTDDTDELIRTLLARASVSATTSQERQVLVLISAYLDGDTARVDTLARDHLADYPDDLVAVLIASLSAHSAPSKEQS